MENTVAGMLPHDGVLRRRDSQILREEDPHRTLVMASCDPAAGLLAREYERATGFRLLPIHRSSREALPATYDENSESTQYAPIVTNHVSPTHRLILIVFAVLALKRWHQRARIENRHSFLSPSFLAPSGAT